MPERLGDAQRVVGGAPAYEPVAGPWCLGARTALQASTSGRGHGHAPGLVAGAPARYHPGGMRNKRDAAGSQSGPARRSVASASRASVASFRDDVLFPRVERAVAGLLANGMVVAQVQVLVAMGLLPPEKLEDWRRGRVPYLERVINCNLTRLSRLLRILRFHAHDLKLAPSMTAYMRWGKGPKHPLRFTKTGDPGVEEAYARHFVWPGKGPFRPPAPKETRD